MGAYIGSMLAKLGNSYLDEQQNQGNLKRRATLDAQAEQDRQARIADQNERTGLARLQQEFNQGEAQRKTAQMELEREQLDAALERAGVTDPIVRKAMTQDAPTARSYLTKPKEPVQKPEDVYTEQDYRGGTARMKNGHFDTWIIRPAGEKDGSANAAVQETRKMRQESSLAQRYQNNPIVKQGYGQANALAPVSSALAQDTPVGDLMALYGIVKLYDPNSVVREGEIKLAQSAMSLPTKLRVLLSNAAYGRKLTPEYRQQIAGIAQEIVSQQKSLVNPVMADYGRDAARFGVDSASVAPDMFRGIDFKGGAANPYKKLPRR